MDDRPAQLTRYEAARFALAEARRVDEVKHIRNQTVALGTTPARPRTPRCFDDATEIRLRAEHRAGVLLAAIEKAKPRGSNQHEERSRPTTDPPTLGSWGDQDPIQQMAAAGGAARREVRNPDRPRQGAGRRHDDQRAELFDNRTLLSIFVEKLLAEYASGAVEQAILLTHDYTDVAWFHAAARAAQVVCFPSGRILSFRRVATSGRRTRARRCSISARTTRPFGARSATSASS